MRGLGLLLHPNCATYMECSVCGQVIDDKVVQETRLATELFGRTTYGVCCCCKQEVDPYTEKDRAYRARWRRWRAKLMKRHRKSTT